VSLGEKRFRVVKSKAGRRTIAIPPILLDELERHYQRTPFKADDDRVFCHARRGSVYSAEMWRPPRRNDGCSARFLLNVLQT
jgi:hypothetical protein